MQELEKLGKIMSVVMDNVTIVPLKVYVVLLSAISNESF